MESVARVGQPALQRHRELQLVEAKHGEGEGDEHRGESAQHPWVLQCHREHHPGQPGRDPRHRVGHRHAEHVGGREQETPRLGDGLAGPDDDTGEDRHHRQHAGCKREQQPETEEARNRQPEPAFEYTRNARVIRSRARPGEHPGRSIAAHRACGQRCQPQLGLLLVGHIAHADIRAALRQRCELYRRHAHVSELKRQHDAEAATISLDLAEEFVAVLLACRKLRLAGPHVWGAEREAELVPVHVVAGRDLVAHLDRARVLQPGGEVERLVRLEQLRLRCASKAG
jgi:hypothetical protein